jgi:5-methylcytosine-specific restriction endonuclease McrA
MPTKEYIREYRLKRKTLAIEMLGGKCSRCGTIENLHFDHINPQEKTNEIASMFTSKIEDFILEVRKCQLLCNKCHYEKSIKNGDYLINRKEWSHGVSGYTNHHCRCDICKEAQSKYKAKRRKKGLKT